MAERKRKTTKKSTDSFVPFEKEHKLEELKLFMIVVNSGQSNAIDKYLFDLNIAASFITNGEGTAKETNDIFGVTGQRKQIIWALVPNNKVSDIKEKLKNRFSISKASQGMALSIKVSSIVGVSLYKFFSGMGMETK